MEHAACSLGCAPAVDRAAPGADAAARAVPQRSAGPPGPRGLDLGDDREGDLFRVVRAHVQADRAVQTLPVVLADYRKPSSLISASRRSVRARGPSWPM